MILSSVLLLSVSPLPKSVQITDKHFGLTNITLSCHYKNNNECKRHIFDNFNFYVSKLFPREAPYTESEYKSKGIEQVISSVSVLIETDSEKLSPLSINESYKLTINDKGISIEAANSFALSRAFASLIQLTNFHPKVSTDYKAYAIYETQITDSSLYPWRELLIDCAKHYMSLKDIKLEIDAMALAKYNVLHILLTDAESFHFKSQLQPTSNLFNGAYSKYYFYTIADIKEIKIYCHQRGLFLELEIPVPTHTASWKHAHPDLVTNCPNSEKKNIYSATLNPTDAVTLGYVEFLVNELIKQRPTETPFILHFGDGQFSPDCWNEDPKVQKFMADNNMTAIDLHKGFYEWFNVILQQAYKEEAIKPIYVFGDALLENDVKIPPYSVIQVSKSVENAKKAASQNYNILLSVNWDLDTMSPGGQWTYLQMDTVEDLYRQNVAKSLSDVERSYIIGGGARMYGTVAWGQSQNAQIYPRSFAVVENLWNPSNYQMSNNVRDRFENLACRMLYYGIQAGPLRQSPPCFGYQHQ